MTKIKEKDTKEAVKNAKKKLHDALSYIKFLHEQGQDDFIRDEMLHAGMNLAGYFEHEVKKRMDIGGQEIILTANRAYLRTYTGYEVSITPYTTDAFGKAIEPSLYSAIREHFDLAESVKGHEDEPLTEGDDKTTKGDMLWANATVLKANTLYPTTAFVDYEEASKFANEYMQRLIKMQEELKATMEAEAPKDDEATNVEAEHARKATETALEGIEESKNEEI